MCLSNETDFVSLLAFKSAIDLDPLGALSSWNKSTHFCRWNGIRCGRRHPDRVVEINLRSQGLVGSLSPHIGNLSLLKTIKLQNNTFRGQIPQQIGFLRKLKYVGFSNNSFVGSIPQNFSQCSQLLYLFMYNNKLSGVIPPELGLLHELKVLTLVMNQLSGPIPPSFGNLTSLEQISLSVCNFHGEIPESFSGLKNLLILELAANHLTGAIPIGLFNMSQLYALAIDTNELEGTIPSNIGFTLPEMRFLYLADNNFSGLLPISLSNLSHMEQLVLSMNHFTGKVPLVEGFANLVDFFIGGNNIQDDTSFITSLTNCTSLVRIDAGYNILSGSLPNTISNLSSQLTDLYLAFNEIHGNIPSGIGNLVSLNTIAVANNHLEGPIPEGLGKLSNLHMLHATNNRFNNSLPSSFGNLTSLNRLYLDGNNLLGNLPSTLGNCTNLLDFDLSFNNFSGVIPPEIMSLSSISISFVLSNNHFEGEIPDEVGSLRNLVTLDMSNNRLSGRIPNTLAKCVILQKLYLQGNLLEGEISSGLSDLAGLQYLDLSRNTLSGPIPSFLGKLKLEYLNLSFNRLHGELPTVGIFLNKTSIFLDGNAQLCGGIPELKLPPCPAVKSGRKKTLSTLLKILIPIVGVGGICLFLAALFIYKKRKPEKDVAPAFTGVQFLRLSYAVLLKATDGFSKNNLLGAGRFGSVYKGILDDGETFVAIKVLNLFVKGASKSFMAECNALRGIRHRNLLKVLSVCESIDYQGNDFKALVYEFKSNGSLEQWLHRSSEGEETMIQRLNIAVDIAQAIKYLHFGTDSTIIHGDLKPSNILLDHDMNACVGDFGLAKITSNIVSSHESSSSTRIRGTLGYVPPEYGMCNTVSTQGDVYSFGIVLLEMFTNKRPTDDLFEDHSNLHNFVTSYLPDRVLEIVDPLFRTEFVGFKNEEMECVASILSIGVSCSKEIPKDRMSIVDVVNELSKIQLLLSRQRR
ncbi:hypothetical protein C2S52_023672 [Perilla frutescens var. hirtella]|nr:hypothetical protein C2S52_023672 [Perilla frutescens var. hirtella]